MSKISAIICAYNQEKTIKEGCTANFWRKCELQNLVWKL